MSRIMWGVETDPVTINREKILNILKQDLWIPLWVAKPKFITKRSDIKR